MAQTNTFCNYSLNITKHTEGTKMDSMLSLSTSVLLNENCKRNATVKGSICEKCYSHTMALRYKGLRENTTHNTEVLTSEIIPTECLPRINANIFRFEAFGDLNNETQFINYLNICEFNPRTQFSIWTKCPHIMKKVFDDMGYKKPSNLIILVSSLMINKALDINNYWFADKVFTVYTAEYAIENNISINCGNKHCIDCQMCYSHNDVVYVNEILKSDLNKYLALGGKVN